MNLLEALQTKDSLTYNGAVTHSTSMNACLDMFFLAGSSRAMPERDMETLFVKAYNENPELAMKVLFWSRDCRGGAGERRFFQYCFGYWLRNYATKKNTVKLLSLVPEYGYWKDLLRLASKDAVDLFAQALLKEDRLAAKWCPRDGDFAEAVRSKLRVSPKSFRKILSTLSNTVEQKMCARNWESILYNQVPSVAFQNYKRAFERHDETRFNEFIDAAKSGEVTVKAGQLFPYQLYTSYRKGDRKDIINVQWDALPNYLEGNDKNFIVLADVSSSMYNFSNRYGGEFKTTDLKPIEISVSLGVYLSERSKGVFKDAILTFSEHPQLVTLKGTATERFDQLYRAPWGGSTNLQATFDLILSRALQFKVAKEDMPTDLIIISDMEFNMIEGYTGYKTPQLKTNLEAIREKYAKSGYDMPRIVFWNVNGRVGNVPAKAQEKGVALVSGASPSIVQSVLTGKTITPVDVMLNTVMSERYAAIQL